MIEKSTIRYAKKTKTQKNQAIQDQRSMIMSFQSFRAGRVAHRLLRR